ncbi:PAS domain S-box protein [Dictyobacter formicarum]|uniref:histidine kinase n=1 Tax=Dictyobacter formicarum TaxID=2778368 RepID=A0ABQ3VG86_9CHLR|nr:PAS domain S-box protein [Dictyobacter formicarum]GHO84724.1 hypothetical protein KSZ_27300 [Dictyobacter formicarum]
MEGYLATRSIAQQLGVKFETVRRWVRQRKLPALPLGGAGSRISETAYEASSHQQSDAIVPSFTGPPFLPLQELSEAEKHLAHMAAIIDSSQDAIIGKTLDGIITSWNASASRLYGYTEAEILGRPITLIIPEERHAEYTHIMERLRRGERVEALDTMRQHKDGTRCPVSITISPVHNTKGELIGAAITARDISERVQMEAALHTSEERFRATFEQAAVGIAHVAPDGRFLAVNQRLCDMVGYTREELLARTFQDITFPDDLEIDLAYVGQLLSGKRQTYTMEKRYVCRDGSLIWIDLTVSLVRDEHGIPRYFISVIEDIDERKHLETILEREQQVLQQITDNIPDVIERFDRSFRRLYVNPAITVATGKLPEEMIGKTNEELGMPEEALALWNTALRRVVETGETGNLEFSIPSATGPRFYQSHLVPERNAQGEITSILSVARDMTDLKQTQAALAQSEARARRFVDSNIIGVVIADMNGIIEANDAFLNLIGATHEDLEVGKVDWRAVTPPEYLPRDDLGLQELRERGVCTPFEKEYVRSDGSRVAVLIGAAAVQIEPLQWVCFILDITERKRQEQRLQQALDALLLVAAALVIRKEPTGALQHDTAPYTATARRVLVPICQVLSCQGAILTKFFPASDMIDMLVTVGFDSSTEQTIFGRLRGQSLSSRFEDETLVARLHRGEVVTLDLTQEPYSQRQPRPDLHTAVVIPVRLGEELVGLLTLYLQAGRASYTQWEYTLAVAMAKLAALLIERERLFTERKEAEMQARTAQEVTRQMDDFIGIVSHELKTPLTAIKGNLQLVTRQLQRLQAQVSAPEEENAKTTATALMLLSRATGQLSMQTRMVNDLLDVSRLRTERLELQVDRCDLIRIVQEVVEDQRVLAPTRHIELHATVQDIPVYADAGRVGQVLTNYLNNALKYSKASYPVDIHVSLEGAMARVAVQDHGPGLSPEQQQHIWERFYRVPDIKVMSGSGVGLGLGLHISKQLIERQSGQVGVESVPGAGSTFWFTLPRVQS